MTGEQAGGTHQDAGEFERNIVSVSNLFTAILDTQAEEEAVRFLTEGQLRDALLPAPDHHALSDDGLEWASSVSGRIELVAVEQGSDVVDGHRLSRLGEGLAARRGATRCQSHGQKISKGRRGRETQGTREDSLSGGEALDRNAHSGG